MRGAAPALAIVRDGITTDERPVRTEADCKRARPEQLVHHRHVLRVNGVLILRNAAFTSATTSGILISISGSSVCI